jgi:hypothetical protein
MTKDKQQHTRYHQLSKRVYLLLVSSQASLEVYVDRDRRVPDWGVPVRRAYLIVSVIERSLPRVQVVSRVMKQLRQNRSIQREQEASQAQVLNDTRAELANKTRARE